MDGIGTIELEPRDTGQFPIQTTLQLQGSFIATLTGQLADPTTVNLLLAAPNAAASLLSYPAQLMKVAVGIYTYSFTPTVSGLWTGTWQGVGVITATRDFTFNIVQSLNIPG